MDKYLPLRKLTKNEIKSQFKPWITNDIRLSISRREKLYKKFIKAKDPKLKDALHSQYRELRNQIVTLIRRNKKKYYQQYFIDNANNIKNTWKGVKAIININSSMKSQVTSILENNEIISDPFKVANSFNKYFSSIASELQGKIYHHGLDFNTYLKNRNDNSFFITPTDKTEIIDIINSFIISKASGPHSIPTDILHLIKLFIADPLSQIINLSFDKGIYIDNLKIAKTIPIYKEKGSDLLCCNYRPISLLSNINKIIEKIMHTRLYKFLSKYNCIFNLQFGFREKHSTNHALIDLTENIRNALDNNLFAVGIFIDLQKAFDTVDHNILLNKLEHYGIRGITNKWFESYLTNRLQYVSINGTDSNVENMQFGVPQGSVLGPILFLMYINDLNNAIKFSTTRHFADDTNLLISNNNLKKLKKQLNFDLRNLSNWLKSNKISLNASKTEMLIFRSPYKKINYELNIKLDGKKIYPSKYVKYLGVLLDEHLNWNFNSNLIASRLSRANGMLLKIRHYVPKPTLRSVYFGIFSSILTYGSQIWGQKFNIHTQRILSLQNRAIRIISFADFNEPSSKLYKDNNILKLCDHNNLQKIFFVYDSIKGNLPSVLNTNFTVFQNLHNLYTRASSQMMLELPKANTERYGISSIKFRAAHIWNYLLNKFPHKDLHVISKATCKKFITKQFINDY